MIKALRYKPAGRGFDSVSFELSRKKVVFGVFNLQWKVKVAV